MMIRSANLTLHTELILDEANHGMRHEPKSCLKENGDVDDDGDVHRKLAYGKQGSEKASRTKGVFA